MIFGLDKDFLILDADQTGSGALGYGVFRAWIVTVIRLLITKNQFQILIGNKNFILRQKI